MFLMVGVAAGFVLGTLVQQAEKVQESPERLADDLDERLKALEGGLPDALPSVN